MMRRLVVCFMVKFLPPVATHWIVSGSPSLNGPTGLTEDSCFPRSPSIRGMEGGTDFLKN